MRQKSSLPNNQLRQINAIADIVVRSRSCRVRSLKMKLTIIDADFRCIYL
ncbi:MAG: hypothetical protein WBM44_01005 [Waterburya sp.]